MKLSISNLAWSTEEDQQVSTLMKKYGFAGVEIAPTKIWNTPVGVDLISIEEYRKWWSDSNIPIIALQSLLFGQERLKLFDPAQTMNTQEYLASIIQLGGLLGAQSFVFGSPRNRQVGSLSLKEAYSIIVPLLEELGEVAFRYGAQLCIEPNPADYGCDFICTTQEGIHLVKTVNHPGIALHLDAAAMTLNREDIERSLDEAFPYLAHFHISEPNLLRVSGQFVDHPRIANSLRSLRYSRFASIEMRDGLADSNIDSVEQALQYVSDIYTS